MPALTALFVIFTRAVVATTPNAENLDVKASTPLLKPESPLPLTLFKLLLISVNPLEASFILRLSFNFLRLLSVVATPLSNPLLLNCMLTILLSIELMR